MSSISTHNIQQRLRRGQSSTRRCRPPGIKRRLHRLRPRRLRDALQNRQFAFQAYTPTIVDTRQAFTQTLLPAQPAAAPLAAAPAVQGSTLPAHGVPAHLVYGSSASPSIVVSQPATIRLSSQGPVGHNQVLANVRSTPTLAGPSVAQPTLAAAPRLASAAPAMEITDLPPVQRTTQRPLSAR